MKQPILLLVLLLMSAVNVKAQNKPDSLFFDEYINKICITDPQRALALLDEAEKENKRPPHRINYLRCLVYQNGFGQSRIALDYGRKAFQSDSTRNNPALALSLLELMVDQCCEIGDYPQCIRYTITGAEIARQTDDKSGEANMLHYNGIAKREMGLKEEAESYFFRVIDLQKELVENSRDWKDIDDLIYTYGTLITAYQEDGEFQKAIDLMPEYEALMEKLKTCPDLPDGVVDQRYASEYAAYACIFAQNGEPEKARDFYRKYLDSDYASMPDGEYIRIEYLLHSGQYGEALQYIQKKKQDLADHNQTVSFSFLHYVLEYEARAYTGLGDYRKAAESYKRMLAISDSLNTNERQNMTLELSTIYETNEKNAQIQEQSAQLRQTRIILIAAFGIIFLSIVIIWLVNHNLRTTRAKNRILVKQIDELLIFRDELTKAKEEIRLLTPKPEEKTKEERGEEGDEETAPAAKEPKPDRKLFDILDTLVNDEQLYLDPDLTRDILIKRTGIPKNAFSQLLQAYAHTNFNGYINNKRLEHSIRLLRDSQNYTIQAVAFDSGFNNTRTYHRAFRENFGITPSEYRENMGEISKI